MKQAASAFVEVIAVIFVLGLITVVAIPDHETPAAADDHRALIASLKKARTAIDRYWGDNDAVYPSLADVKSLTNPSVLNTKRVNKLAVYLDRIPLNPYTKGNTVAGPSAEIGASDWIYDPQSGVFKANDSTDHRGL